MCRICLGIDVSKKTLDAALIINGKTISKQFKNSAAGYELLAAWLRLLHSNAEGHVCLEATGATSEAVALFLREQGHRISIVNPLRIKGFAQSNLRRNKTDRLDARLIAAFCQTQEPAEWTPLSAPVRHLQALVRRIEVVEEMRQAEENRLATAPPQVQPSVERMIALLETEIKELEQQIKQHVNNHPELKEQSELLQTIPGIGARTAHLMLAEIEFERFDSARQAAAQADVVPQQRQSGTSLKQTGLSKLGNARIRKALYFPAKVPSSIIKLSRIFAARLNNRGKTPMQVVCTAMLKLLHIAFGVLKHKRAFDASLPFAA